MSNLDLSKLTPAPWRNDGDYWVRGPLTEEGEPALFEGKYLAAAGSDMEFCALARNAFDVMMRRGWNAVKTLAGNWFVPEAFRFALKYPELVEACYADNPFTALVEADKWMKEQESKNAQS